MAFLTTRMPRRLAAGYRFGGRWLTGMTEMENGREKRNGRWAYPRWEGIGNVGAFDSTDREALLAMGMATRGKLHAFRVFDPNEHTASVQPLVTVGAKLYLAKAYVFGGQTAHRLIHAPITAVLSGAGSVNMDTGEVTGSAPGDTWSGEFDTWMRFDSDVFTFTAERPDVWTADVNLIEVRR